MSFARCSRPWGLGLMLALALPVLAVAPASAATATHEPILIDGNLADLIAAAQRNSSGVAGGCPNMLTRTLNDCNFASGYDMTPNGATIFVDFLAGGKPIPDVTLYGGWETTGLIGDYDGNGSPTTFSNTQAGCAVPGDEAGTLRSGRTGIAASESYSFLIYHCGSGQAVRLGVTDNQVVVLDPPGFPAPIPGAVYAVDPVSGKTLEVKVPDLWGVLKSVLGPTIDICDLQIRLTTDARDDGKGEDRSDPCVITVPPSITVAKTPPNQSACIGTEVSWTIPFSNNGTCVLHNVVVADTLGAGLEFVSSNPPSTGDAHIRNWSYPDINLAPGEGREITLTARVVGPCTQEPLRNDVTVEGEHIVPDTPLCPGGASTTAKARASAFVECLQPNVSIDKSLSKRTLLPGEKTTVTLTVTNTGASDLDPVTVCDWLSPGTSFDESQTIGGSCGATLAGVTNNPDGSKTVCFTNFSLLKSGPASCTITYEVDCETPGIHPDTVRVTAYCKGTRESPATAWDYDSFTCQGGGSCPRTVGFWGQQVAQKGNGSTKFTLEQVTAIAKCIDDRLDAFNWSDDFAGFQAIITPERPMDCRKQALRQFAGMVANYCVGSLGYLASNGDSIFLNATDPNPCMGTFKDASTLGDLIDAIDDQLAALQSEGADAQDHRYCEVVECADGINNGRGIPIDPRCAEETMPPAPSSGGAVDPQAGGASGAFELYRPTPNPFNNSTTIAYAVGGGASADVQIGIYNVAGRLVRSLVSGLQATGRYQVSCDGRGDDGASVTRGVYFLRAHVGGQRIEAASRILYLK